MRNRLDLPENTVTCPPAALAVGGVSFCEILSRKIGVYFSPVLCYTICSSAGWADPGIILRDVPAEENRNILQA